MWSVACLYLGVAAAGLLSFAPALRAETLQDALIEAYRTNPDLLAQRAKLRGTDEAYVQAQAEFAATISLESQATYSHDAFGRNARLQARLFNSPTYSERNSISPQLVVTQPLFTSGRVSADIKAADAQVKADRQALRIAEANVLIAVIQAYADVVRDQAALNIRKTNLDQLTHQLAETRAMQKAGEITRTDVAQIEAQLASEQDLNGQAQAQLEISRANYVAAVGQAPGTLASLPELSDPLGSLSEIVASAEKTSPALQQALFIEEASHAKIYAAKASEGLNVNAQVQAGYQGSLVPYDGRNLDHVVSVTVNMSLPLSTGGQLQSQTRQAYDQNEADQMNVESVHRLMVRTLVTAWQQWRAAQLSVESENAAVQSASVEFEGMGKEYKAAERSTLDVLSAEEALVTAELALNAARRDAYIYKAAVLQNMGRLEIANLTQIDRAYDPDAHLKAVMPKISPILDAPLEKLDGLGGKPVKSMSVTSNGG